MSDAEGRKAPLSVFEGWLRRCGESLKKDWEASREGEEVVNYLVVGLICGVLGAVVDHVFWCS